MPAKSDTPCLVFANEEIVSRRREEEGGGFCLDKPVRVCRRGTNVCLHVTDTRGKTIYALRGQRALITGSSLFACQKPTLLDLLALCRARCFLGKNESAGWSISVGGLSEERAEDGETLYFTDGFNRKQTQDLTAENSTLCLVINYVSDNENFWEHDSRCLKCRKMAITNNYDHLVKQTYESASSKKPNR